MDEVEALADRVAVLFGQEIVASGTPGSIGGRDVGAVTIRFRLPEGVSAAALPLEATPADDGHVEISTEDEVRVLHELTGWALAGGHALAGLSVLRVSLEDVYLGLTRATGGSAGDEVAAS
jgi:ABC-2 type transport system ATP-binding protein